MVGSGQMAQKLRSSAWRDLLLRRSESCGGFFLSLLLACLTNATVNTGLKGVYRFYYFFLRTDIHSLKLMNAMCYFCKLKNLNRFIAGLVSPAFKSCTSIVLLLVCLSWCCMSTVSWGYKSKSIHGICVAKKIEFLGIEHPTILFVMNNISLHNVWKEAD
jgi:hypothetical protein